MNAKGQKRSLRFRPSLLAVAISADELFWKIKPAQRCQRFARHRPGQNVAAYDHHFDARQPYLRQNRFERGKVAMNVVDGRHFHRFFHTG